MKTKIFNNRLLYCALLLVFLFFQTSKIFSQTSFELKTHYGFIAKHKPSLEYLVRGDIKGIEFSYLKKQTEPEYWKKSYRSPYWGLTYSYINFGNPDQLGFANALVGFFRASIIEKKHFLWQYQIGNGLAYLNKGNDAIGSHFNVYVNFNTNISYKIKKHSIYWAIGAIHYSNGGIQMPNLGLNMFTTQLGYLYTPDFENKIESNFNSEPQNKQNLQIGIIQAGGIKEIRPEGGTKFGFYNLTANLYRNISFRRKIYVGLDAVYDKSILEILNRKNIFVDNKLEIMRYGTHLGHVAYAGRIGFVAELGYMFHSPEIDQAAFFERAGLKFVFNDLFQAHLLVRAHKEKADAVEWGIEFLF